MSVLLKNLPVMNHHRFSDLVRCVEEKGESPPLFTFFDLEETYLWLCENRKDYGDNSEIWNFRSKWDDIKFEGYLHSNSSNGLS